MPLSPDAQLGHYKILSMIGKGGMGEVYRARDTTLKRDVALKLLPADFARNPERMARFQREAEVLASLDHPNIGSIYGIVESGGARALVLALIEGPTLADKIAAGPIAPDEALAIAKQIIEALEYAHEHNVIHRDLKPANIKINLEGVVKVLDFGLAKVLEDEPPAAAPGDSPTVTAGRTRSGVIMGTAAYMAPEQAVGRHADRRSDIFSFGAVLYEMLTGQRAFAGATLPDVLEAVVKSDPDWARLPVQTAPAIRRLLRRCLIKDRKQRLQAIGEARIALGSPVEEAVAPRQQTTESSARTWRFVPGAIVAGFAAGFALAMIWLEGPAAPARYIPFATEPGIQTMPAWSPAGDRIAYSGEASGIFQIFVRKIGSSTPAQITRQDASCFLPFWSPDSTRIYYIVDRQGVDQSLWSTGVAGGDAEKVLDGVGRASLSPDGKTLVVAARQPDNTYALMISSPPGSPPRPFPQALISSVRTAFRWGMTFQFTKDGKYLGLLTNFRARWEFWKIPMDGGSPDVLAQKYLRGVSPIFGWLSDREIVWADNSSGDGHLMHRHLRSGEDRAITSGASQERYHAISMDDRTLAFQAGEVGYDLIEVPLDGAPPTPVLATDRTEVAPGWAPDGLHFAYATDRDGTYEIWLRNRRDGSERRIVSAHDFPDGQADSFLDCAISPDGSRVAYRRTVGASVEIWISPLAGGTPVRLYNDPRNVFQRGVSWSPDGNWIAYYSAFNGKPSVLKARVGANREPELVAHASNLNPVRWSPRGDWIAWNDGHKLALASPDGKQKRILSHKQWLTYGWSQDGHALYGIGVTENRRLILGRVEITGARDQVAADLGPMPGALDLADSQGDFPYRGFSMRSDGKSFLTSVLAIKGDIWLMEDFDRRVGWLDRLLRRR